MEMSDFVRRLLGVGLTPEQEMELDFHAVHIPQARAEAVRPALDGASRRFVV